MHVMIWSVIMSVWSKLQIYIYVYNYFIGYPTTLLQLSQSETTFQFHWKRVVLPSSDFDFTICVDVSPKRTHIILYTI